MTEYTPTEPEITEALVYLVDHLAEPHHMPSDVAADILTLAVVRSALRSLDDAGSAAPEQVRAARAALAARERWAEQETKAA